MAVTRINRLAGTPIVVPVTQGGNFARRRGFVVPLDGAGTRTSGVIRCDQPRALDFRARKAQRVESVPEGALADVLRRLRAILA